MRLANLYRTFVRDSLIALSRATKRTQRRLLMLDMDWYRYSWTDEQARNALYENPILTPHVDFVRIDREQVLRKPSTPLPPLGRAGEDLRGAVHSGFRLWGICKASLAALTATPDPDPASPEYRETSLRILEDARTILENVRELFLRLRPDAVLVFQGGYFDSRCVVEMARRLGIRVIGVENFMIPGTIVLDDLSGQIINRHRIARMGSELMEVRHVPADSLEATWQWWHAHLNAKAPEHRTGGVDRPEDLRRELELPESGKLLLLLAQVATDASVILDSPLFDSQWEFIEAVVRSTRALGDVTLVIRLHPKEKSGSAPGGRPYDRLTFKELARRGILELEGVRVVEDPRFNTHVLIEMSDACITINSQAGFEAALLGRPVVVCGEAFYGRKGFTWDLGHAAALDALIRSALSHPSPSPTVRIRATELLYWMRSYSLFDRDLREDSTKVRNFFLRGCCDDA